MKAAFPPYELACHLPGAYRLWRRVTASYLSPSPRPSPFQRILLEWPIRLVTAILGAFSWIRFPKRAVGGWWWIWRYRFEMQVGWYELPTAQWIRGLLQRGSVAADIGAHIGYFTHAMSIEVGPGGHVFAFEPSPENFSLLQRNVARAGLANAACSQLAVADRTGAETMYVSPGHSNHSLVPGYAESGETVQVNATTLDAFLAPVKLGPLCLVKVDAEGAEPRILKGMRQTIESTPDLVLVIEINPRALECAGSSPDLLIDAIESSDLVPRLIDPDGGLVEPRGHAFDDAPNLLCMRQHMWDRLIQSQQDDGFSR